jgi:hypothetical protein
VTYLVLRDYSSDPFVDLSVTGSPCWEIVIEGGYEECRVAYNELVNKGDLVKLLAQVLASDDKGHA